MTKQPMDDSNWREDYKGYKHLNKKQRELLENETESISILVAWCNVSRMEEDERI